MGDVIHTLPALTDAARAMPSVTFDWVVEEAFTEIPAWHPAVSQVIPVAIRRWRKDLFNTVGSNEWKQFKISLRKFHYDLVIDAQGLLKSAWVVRRVKAPAAGFDRYSAREPLASWFYQHKISVPKQMHAVERSRELFAHALNYSKPADKGDYGIDPHRFYGSSVEPPNVVFLHGTTRDDKHYPEPYWRRLAIMLTQAQYRVRLPWGNEVEKARAERIVAGIDNAEVLPKLNLQGVAGVLAQARAVVAVDTGLGHLSAALNIPTVSLYGSTNPALVGTYGENQIHLQAGDFAVPEADHTKVEPAIFSALVPEQVYRILVDKMLASRSVKVG